MKIGSVKKREVKPVKIKEEYNPKAGDTRDKACFAFFPQVVEDKIIWLEKYICKQVYESRYEAFDVVVSEGIFSEKYYTTHEWVNRWVTKSKSLIIK